MRTSFRIYVSPYHIDPITHTRIRFLLEERVVSTTGLASWFACFFSFHFLRVFLMTDSTARHGLKKRRYIFFFIPFSAFISSRMSATYIHSTTALFSFLFFPLHIFSHLSYYDIPHGSFLIELFLFFFFAVYILIFLPFFLYFSG